MAMARKCHLRADADAPRHCEVTLDVRRALRRRPGLEAMPTPRIAALPAVTPESSMAASGRCVDSRGMGIPIGYYLREANFETFGDDSSSNEESGTTTQTRVRALPYPGEIC